MEFPLLNCFVILDEHPLILLKIRLILLSKTPVKSFSEFSLARDDVSIGMTSDNFVSNSDS